MTLIREYWVLGLIAAAGMTAASASELWTLERAVSCAMTNSPDARVAEQRIAAAQAGLEQANSAIWPRLQLQSTYLRTDNPVAVFGSLLNQRDFNFGAFDINHPPQADNLNLKGQVTLPLYVGGKIAAGRQAAKAGVQAAKHSAEAARATLAFEAARAFHTVLKARRFIDAAEAAARSYENNLSIASKRHKAGTLLKTEVLDVEVRLAQAREDLVRARNARALAERALRTLLGVEESDFAVADTAPAVPAPAAGEVGQRPELAAIRQQLKAAEAAVRQARGGYLPQVGAFASVDHDHGWEFNGSGDSWTVGGVLQWDLWDGRLTRGRVREARAQLESLREQERKTRLWLDLEAEQARLNLQEASERLAVTEKAVTQAAESVELTRARFEQGLALATQLIDAETALTGARVRRAEAQTDQRIALAALRKALGLPQLP
jgi:outer membrane protein TolC